jgi:hypothetical protein
MCTLKQLLHRQQAFLAVLRSDRSIKIKPPTRHGCAADVHGTAEEIFEEYTRLLRGPTERTRGKKG